MSRSNINALVTEMSLSFVSVTKGQGILDLVAEDQVQHNIPLKNVCCKVLPALSDEIDEIVGLLSISKRRFLESAIRDGIAAAKAIMEEEGVFALGDEMAGEGK